MEVCCLRGDCRSGDFGEPAIDEIGPDARHKKQEKVRGFIWARPLIPKNTIRPSALSAREMGSYPRTPGGIMFAEHVEVLDSLKKNLKSSKRWKIESEELKSIKKTCIEQTTNRGGKQYFV
jgi:hypothetical protein